MELVFLAHPVQLQLVFLAHPVQSELLLQVEFMEKRQTEMERVRLSSPVRKARKESVRFVAPHAAGGAGGDAAAPPQLHLAQAGRRFLSF